ncbi:hypothetical protein ACFOG5_24025 [Pedobacter fastidiosus]|uniref:6-phosphogluconate dehydrogenase n=1 Tax=Pedobacter fastidiosus TaxID=2765361 RepID=A0ABR7KX27_9SPHI|nr:hypothetical protein [Pedobacter fastidiosus]MBC6112622.1 hypothetical protein [Pedobacter fastidiosus]
MTKGKRIGTIAAVIAILLLIGLAYYNYFFVFGEGVKAGELNYIVKKGYIFKTNEGKLIQSGVRSRQTGTLQNNEFEFSVSDENIAAKLMGNSGKFYELHYREYKSSLPWRGFSKYVVDSIYAAREIPD